MLPPDKKGKQTRNFLPCLEIAEVGKTHLYGNPGPIPSFKAGRNAGVIWCCMLHRAKQASEQASLFCSCGRKKRHGKRLGCHLLVTYWSAKTEQQLSNPAPPHHPHLLFLFLHSNRRYTGLCLSLATAQSWGSRAEQPSSNQTSHSCSRAGKVGVYVYWGGGAFWQANHFGCSKALLSIFPPVMYLSVV